MAITRLPTAALSLKQFMQRQKVLGIYRTMLRTIRQVPDAADQKYLKDWAREEFNRNKNATNPEDSARDSAGRNKYCKRVQGNAQDAIRMMITQANNHLEDLQKTIALAK